MVGGRVRGGGQGSWWGGRVRDGGRVREKRYF